MGKKRKKKKRKKERKKKKKRKKKRKKDTQAAINLPSNETYPEAYRPDAKHNCFHVPLVEFLHLVLTRTPCES